MNEIFAASLAKELSRQGCGPEIAAQLRKPGDITKLVSGSYTQYYLNGHVGWCPYLKAPESLSSLGCHGEFPTEEEAIAQAETELTPFLVSCWYTASAHPPVAYIGCDIVAPSNSPMGRHFAEVCEAAELVAELERDYQ